MKDSLAKLLVRIQTIFHANSRQKNESAYALLEYCAGAAVVAVVLWAAMQALGDSVSTLIGSIGDWALARAEQVGSGQVGSGTVQ